MLHVGTFSIRNQTEGGPEGGALAASQTLKEGSGRFLGAAAAAAVGRRAGKDYSWEECGGAEGGRREGRAPSSGVWRRRVMHLSGSGRRPKYALRGG